MSETLGAFSDRVTTRSLAMMFPNITADASGVSSDGLTLTIAIANSSS